MAKIITNSLFLLLGALSFVATIQGQDQSGFISIDCGLPENSNYTEKNTGINYISDANFIDSGVSKTVSPQDKTTHPQYFTYLRSFPYGTRNCYRINVTSVTRYLIRASFLYGNYDGLNKLPEFDLYLGVHFWDTVKFTNSSVSINYEIIHTLSTDYIHICMVNKGKGTSFISVIEMRILDNVNNTYTTQDPTTSLARFRRLDVGISNLTYRYEDDPYDRIWEPYWDDKWTQLSSGFSSDNLIQNDFKVPAVVMETAATPKNATASLDFQWEDDYADNNETQHQYYFYLHFAEFRKLEENQTSSFNISLNDVPWVRRELVYGIAYTRYTTSPLFGHKNFHISIIRAESSSVPPIINALEIYLVKDFSSQLETQKDDADAVTNMKRTYKVDSKNWEGDPCAPIAYKWQGVDCTSYDGFLRITSLNLSSSGLTGHIAVDISKLTMLKSLDLSNNELRGTIPSFLAQLQSLEYLNLANNNLTGSVSNELLQKQSDGLLSLNVGQNPNLCASTSCISQSTDTRKKENNAVIAVVASIAGILLLLVIIAAFIIFLQRKQYGNYS
ncbi:hypothetical protein HN51_053640 [Arachis hypogaea]